MIVTRIGIHRAGLRYSGMSDDAPPAAIPPSVDRVLRFFRALSREEKMQALVQYSRSWSPCPSACATSTAAPIQCRSARRGSTSSPNCNRMGRSISLPTSMRDVADRRCLSRDPALSRQRSPSSRRPGHSRRLRAPDDGQHRPRRTRSRSQRHARPIKRSAAGAEIAHRNSSATK